MNDPVLDLDRSLSRILVAAATGQQTPNGDDSATDQGQPHGNGQNEQAEHETQGQDSDTGQSQPQAGQRTGWWLIEWRAA